MCELKFFMDFNKNIVLIGPQACGKSSVGILFSNKSNLPLFDTDIIFNERFGPIVPFVNQFGAYLFREKESYILEEVLRKSSPGIISTGGGIVYPSGMNLSEIDVFKFSMQNKILLENSLVIYLRYSDNIVEEAEELVRRKNVDAQSESQRIHFNNFEQMLKTRIPHYLSVANYIILTKGLSPEEISDKIFNCPYFLMWYKIRKN